MNYFPKILSQYVFSTNVIVIVFILFFVVVCRDAYGRYKPYGFIFEPLPKYEEKQKPRPGQYTFSKDIHVWVYNRKFAKRFGMPEKWIDDFNIKY